MSEPRVALVGASGLVGGQLLELLEERAFPCAELKLFVYDEGKVELHDGHSAHVFKSPSDLKTFDLAFLAVPRNVATEIIEARPGPLLIDASCTPPGRPSVPLLAPGLTSRRRFADLKGETLFPTPHPAAYALATILNGLGPQSGFFAGTLMIGASSSGRERVAELARESADVLNGQLNLETGQTQRAFNIFPLRPQEPLLEMIEVQVGALLGYRPNLVLQAVEVPVFHGSAITLYGGPRSAFKGWAEKLRGAPGVLFSEAGSDGIVNAIAKGAVVVTYVGEEQGLSLLCGFDNLRLSALCAIWIAENLTPFLNHG